MSDSERSSRGKQRRATCICEPCNSKASIPAMIRTSPCLVPTQDKMTFPVHVIPTIPISGMLNNDACHDVVQRDTTGSIPSLGSVRPVVGTTLFFWFESIPVASTDSDRRLGTWSRHKRILDQPLEVAIRPMAVTCRCKGNLQTGRTGS